MSRNYRGYIGFATDKTGYEFKSVFGGIATLYDTSLNISTVNIVTGGTILTPGDGKRYHVFTSTGQFTTSQSIDNVSVMMVGGGGAGGGRLGGGGGAGGYLFIPSVSISQGTYTATVGAGGNAVPVTFPNSASVRAPNTTFLSYTAYGGGGGSSDNGGSATTGGSGGGGADNAGGSFKPGLNPSTPAPIIASDFPGESHPYAFTQGYAGGPGAPSGGGGAGGNAPAGNRDGGVGVVAGLTLPPSYGTPGPTPGRWFGGGGGGMAYPASAGVGGAGGGGAGSPNSPQSTPGTAGTNNTGGGGGGGGQSSGTSGSGGSGIIVVAYPI
jgi:hypothetical protein